jgi:hypothetical protein
MIEEWGEISEPTLLKQNNEESVYELGHQDSDNEFELYLNRNAYFKKRRTRVV